MFARVAWGKVKPGSWQAYEQVYHDEILPDTRTVSGLVFRELLHHCWDLPCLTMRLGHLNAHPAQLAAGPAKLAAQGAAIEL